MINIDPHQLRYDPMIRVYTVHWELFYGIIVMYTIINDEMMLHKPYTIVESKNPYTMMLEVWYWKYKRYMTWWKECARKHSTGFFLLILRTFHQVLGIALYIMFTINNNDIASNMLIAIVFFCNIIIIDGRHYTYTHT